jgi:hypothetical protein
MLRPDPATEHAPMAEGLQGSPVDVLYREDIKVTRAPIVATVLQGLGFDARVTREDEAELAPGRILLVGGNPRWFRKLLSRVAALPPEQRPYVVVWHTEPLPMPAAAGFPRERLTLREMAKIVLRDRRINDQYSSARYLRRLSREGIVTVLAVSSEAHQAYLAEHGIQSEFVFIGHHPTYGRRLDLERDIPVLFLGEQRVRRRRRILSRLRREGVDVTAFGGSSTTKGHWGEARTELLNRTKVLLNLPRYPGHFSDRVMMGMATGALVVSEPIFLPAPFEPGVHYVECEVDDMAETVRRYLADDDARRRITDTAYTFLTEGPTYEGVFARLLELADHAVGGARPAPG